MSIVFNSEPSAPNFFTFHHLLSSSSSNLHHPCSRIFFSSLATTHQHHIPFSLLSSPFLHHHSHFSLPATKIATSPNQYPFFTNTQIASKTPKSIPSQTFACETETLCPWISLPELLRNDYRSPAPVMVLEVTGTVVSQPALYVTVRLWSFVINL